MLFDLNLVLFGIMFMLILICGIYQEKSGDKYAITAAVLMIADALFIVCVLAFDYQFDILAVTLGINIWIHHAIIHRASDFSDQITFLTLQLKDISNHETWIVACLTAAAVWESSV